MTRFDSEPDPDRKGWKMVIGTVSVTANRILIGDADFPPVGTLIEGVPNGEHEVKGIRAVPDDFTHFAWFSIVFGEGGIPAETVTFSIDGGVVAVADPNVNVPKGFWERRRRKREVYKQILHDFYQRPYSRSLLEGDRVWAVLFYGGDGIYKVRIDRDNGIVTRLRCNMK